MKRNLLPLSVALALTLTACGGQSETPAAGGAAAAASAQNATAAVTGPAIRARVESSLNGTLPEGLSLVLRLLDTTDAAKLPVVINESRRPISGSSAFDVSLAYDPAKIDPARQYGFQVSLMAETLVLDGTERPVPVLTQGAPSDALRIKLVRGGQPSADIPPADLARSEFAKLEAALGGMRRIQGERLEADVAVGWDAFVSGEGRGEVRMAREQVDFGKQGRSEFRYAYRDSKIWVVERVQGDVTTLLAWDGENNILINEMAGGQADEATIAQLRERALALYRLASDKR